MPLQVEFEAGYGNVVHSKLMNITDEQIRSEEGCHISINPGVPHEYWGKITGIKIRVIGG